MTRHCTGNNTSTVPKTVRYCTVYDTPVPRFLLLFSHLSLLKINRDQNGSL